MQSIIVYGEDGMLTGGGRKIFYQTSHERNSKYLEREGESKQFQVLCDVDNCDPSSFWTTELLLMLLHDLEIVLEEARAGDDKEVINHIKEIFILCKLCIWSEGKMSLYFTPYGSIDDFPKDIPEKYRYNIAKL